METITIGYRYILRFPLRAPDVMQSVISCAGWLPSRFSCFFFFFFLDVCFLCLGFYFLFKMHLLKSRLILLFHSLHSSDQYSLFLLNSIWHHSFIYCISSCSRIKVIFTPTKVSNVPFIFLETVHLYLTGQLDRELEMMDTKCCWGQELIFQPGRWKLLPLYMGC